MTLRKFTIVTTNKEIYPYLNEMSIIFTCDGFARVKDLKVGQKIAETEVIQEIRTTYAK
jgi:hypothetical protein